MTMPDEWQQRQSLLSRRRFLQGTAGFASAGLLAELASACGSSGGSTGGSSSQTSATAGGGTPKRGGIVSVAVGDAATSENLDPQRTWNQNHDYFYGPAVWETLVKSTPDWGIVPYLASSATPNHDSTVWTLKMRPGVKWHDGKPLTSRDAAWSIKRILDPKQANPIYGVLKPVLDARGIKTPDARTLEFHLNYPHTLLPLVFAQPGAEIVQDGSDPSKYTAKTAVGTGPFAVKSFSAGHSWELQRNPNYWISGLPYLNGMRGVATPDPTGMVEAVTNGQSHIASSMNFSQVSSLQGTDATTFTVAGSHDIYIIMDTRVKPFGDNRVRQAIKLAMNRETIMKAAYLADSIGTTDTPLPSNDTLYPASLGIRAQNTAQAKKLLAEAGYPNGLSLELYTGDLVGGMVDMATAFAQTVAPAGIKIKITQHPASTYFEQVWLQRPFYVSWITTRHPVVRVPMTMTPDAAWQETHLIDTPTEAQLKKAVAAHGAEQKQLIGEMLTWIADNQGYACPAFANWVFPMKKQLRGVTWQTARTVDFTRAYLA
jgi:peptide/nickel transport system substrate-binding protein